MREYTSRGPTKQTATRVGQTDMKSADYDEAMLHTERFGTASGPPILLLHGWGSSTALMRPLADALPEYHTVGVDLPGHGQSPPPPEPWGIPEYARLVRDLIEREQLAPVTLIGHSNGGRIALYMASDPDLAPRIEQLILISPSGITPKRSWPYYLRKTTATLAKAPFQILPNPFKTWCLNWLRKTPLWRMLGSSDYQRTSGVMRGTFIKTIQCLLDDRVHRITVPTLLFRGTADTEVSAHQMRVLETRIPHAALIPLDGARHYGHLDDPHTVNAAIRAFLKAPNTDA